MPRERMLITRNGRQYGEYDFKEWCTLMRLPSAGELDQHAHQVFEQRPDLTSIDLTLRNIGGAGTTVMSYSRIMTPDVLAIKVTNPYADGSSSQLSVRWISIATFKRYVSETPNVWYAWLIDFVDDARCAGKYAISINTGVRCLTYALEYYTGDPADLA